MCSYLEYRRGTTGLNLIELQHKKTSRGVSIRPPLAIQGSTRNVMFNNNNNTNTTTTTTTNNNNKNNGFNEHSNIVYQKHIKIR